MDTGVRGAKSNFPRYEGLLSLDKWSSEGLEACVARRGEARREGSLGAVWLRIASRGQSGAMRGRSLTPPNPNRGDTFPLSAQIIQESRPQQGVKG